MHNPHCNNPDHRHLIEADYRRAQERVVRLNKAVQEVVALAESALAAGFVVRDRAARVSAAIDIIKEVGMKYCPKCGSAVRRIKTDGGGWVNEFKCTGCGATWRVAEGDPLGGSGDSIHEVRR